MGIHVAEGQEVTKRRKWTEPEDESIRSEYPYGCVESLAERLGRSRSAVRARALELGVRREIRTSPSEARLSGYRIAQVSWLQPVVPGRGLVSATNVLRSDGEPRNVEAFLRARQARRMGARE